MARRVGLVRFGDSQPRGRCRTEWRDAKIQALEDALGLFSSGRRVLVLTVHPAEGGGLGRPPRPMALRDSVT